MLLVCLIVFILLFVFVRFMTGFGLICGFVWVCLVFVVSELTCLAGGCYLFICELFCVLLWVFGFGCLYCMLF